MPDANTLEQLFRQHYAKMLQLARTLLGDNDDAKDVVQDIFLKIADCDIAPQKESYLLTAVRNNCLNRIREMQLHEQVKRLLPIEAERDLQPIDKQLALFEEIYTFVNENLKEPHRSIFHRRFGNDMTIREIALQLGLNPNTTYKYLIQSIEQIRHHFKH